MLNQKFQVEISNWPQIQEKNFPAEHKESIQKIVKNDSSEIHDDIDQLELEIKKRFNKINEIKPNLEGLKKEILAEKFKEKNESVLDPIDRISEVLFGLIMVLSFTGSITIALKGTSGRPALLLSQVVPPSGVRYT